MKTAECFPKGLKTLWEKDELLVTSNLSFSHDVFKILLMQTRKNQGLFGKGLRNHLRRHHLFLLLPRPGSSVVSVSDS